MRKICFLVILIFLGKTSLSQSWDLELTLITPLSQATVDASLGPVSVDFTLRNNGPDPIPMGDTIYFTYSDGTFTNFYGFDNTPFGVYAVILGAEIASGDFRIASLAFGGPFNFDLVNWSAGSQVNVICLGVGDDALTQGGDAQEINLINNFDAFFIGASSLAVNELESNVVVYPNPVNDVLCVESSEKITAITIYGLDGKLVDTVTGVAQIQVSNLNSGVYVYEIQTVSGRVVKDTFMKR